MTEFAIKPSILEVVVENVPVSIPVCSPKVIDESEVVVGAAVVEDETLKGSPPSSFGPSPFAGYTEFVML